MFMLVWLSEHVYDPQNQLVLTVETPNHLKAQDIPTPFSEIIIWEIATFQTRFCWGHARPNTLRCLGKRCNFGHLKTEILRLWILKMWTTVSKTDSKPEPAAEFVSGEEAQMAEKES